MRILVVHPGVPIYGGAERVIVKFCNYMSDHSIVHALAMPGMPDDMKKDLVGTPIISNLLTLVANANNYDVINYHNFPATLFSIFLNKPSVWYCNEPPELFTNRKRKFIEWGNRNLVKNRIENVVVADKFNAERFERIYHVEPKIIPYGIDYDFFSKVEHDFRHDQFTIMQVGTISRYKNQLASIKALAYLRERVPESRLIIVGNVSEPEYGREVETEISKDQLGGRVLWLNHVSRTELLQFYAMADVLIHPCGEQGGWLTPFESISAGVPAVVSSKVSCSDLIESNNLGMIAQSDEAYGPILQDIYNLREYHKDKTLKAKEWVKNNLTWDKFGEQMIEYMESIV